MNETLYKLGSVVTLAVLALVIALNAVSPTKATPNAAPNVEVFVLNRLAIITPTIWAGPAGIGPHENIDIFYSIDQAEGNAITLTLQVSPDSDLWVNHSTKSAVVSGNSADASAHITGPIEGAYYRIVATVANTETVTPTIWAVLR